MAAAEEELNFCGMSEVELRQWVEANPGRINDRDSSSGLTPLTVAASKKMGLSMVVWLLDEKGADPTRIDFLGCSALMHQMRNGTAKVVRLLQDPRVRATVDMQDKEGNTALHHACCKYGGTDAKAALNAHLLLQAGADLTIANTNGQTALADLRQHHPNLHVTIALLEQALTEAEKASLLVKARRLAVAATSNAVAPSCLQARVARGQPLPRVALVPLTAGQADGEKEDEEEGEEGRKLRTALAFMCGVGREDMPRDVFRVVLDLLMPSWDPLRCKNAGTRPSAVQG